MWTMGWAFERLLCVCQIVGVCRLLFLLFFYFYFLYFYIFIFLYLFFFFLYHLLFYSIPHLCSNRPLPLAVAAVGCRHAEPHSAPAHLRRSHSSSLSLRLSLYSILSSLYSILFYSLSSVLSAMSSSIPGYRDLPASQYDLSTYWGRVLHSADLCDPRYGISLSLSLCLSPISYIPMSISHTDTPPARCSPPPPRSKPPNRSSRTTSPATSRPA